MESAIQSKHFEKAKLKILLRPNCIQRLFRLFAMSIQNWFINNALWHQVGFAAKSRQKAISNSNEKR